ncbi:hypothetical protein CONLIGDRAFT_637796 [Coniochaeta ligniaria NRRL 30616]|uniref:Uncharacterized protein n=1 Tax=Coniochaeta ligniaria NRRL 30616 TaxID=1408157 RepID=A0A1J7I6J7_9PEZI|nr:hypothetical protein CONLIGDRAFT_637796 [Coniochaeta ligniaria NRRL 30616]
MTNEQVQDPNLLPSFAATLPPALATQFAYKAPLALIPLPQPHASCSPTRHPVPKRSRLVSSHPLSYHFPIRARSLAP